MNSLSPVNIPRIIEAVENYYHLPIGAIIGHRRWQRFAQARQVAMYIARDSFGYTFSYIGENMGRRDHTTVVHGCHAVEKRLRMQELLGQQLEQIKAQLSP